VGVGNAGTRVKASDVTRPRQGGTMELPSEHPNREPVHVGRKRDRARHREARSIETPMKSRALPFHVHPRSLPVRTCSGDISETKGRLAELADFSTSSIARC